MINQLEWDSAFFGWKTGRASNPGALQPLIEQAQSNNYRLVYLFSETALFPSVEIPAGTELVPADRKVLYAMDLTGLTGHRDSSGVTTYGGDAACSDLLELALLSGTFSRFNTDSHFRNGEFERMYEEWIEAAVAKKIADYVFVTRERGRVTGMVTLAVHDNIARIGLLAVHNRHQGQQLGKRLINACINAALARNCTLLKVPTQYENRNACLFYERSGFKLKQLTNIYHLWLDTKVAAQTAE